MATPDLTIALITDVFFDDPACRRLAARLGEARSRGAALAVLPELPMDRWVPANRNPNGHDAEEPDGRRQRAMADAARQAGIAVLGGAIVRDPDSGRRTNTAVLFGRDGSIVSTYRKVHLPFEENFWEAAHYEPGRGHPRVVSDLGLPLGIQICSDANRTSGCQLLAAQRAGAILHPRATPEDSWPRWRLVLRACAVTSGAWLVSVNRPPEGDPPFIGGPSVVIAPDGQVVCEATDPVIVATLDAERVVRAKDDYPGYLDFHPDVYLAGWAELTSATPD